MAALPFFGEILQPKFCEMVAFCQQGAFSFGDWRRLGEKQFTHLS